MKRSKNVGGENIYIIPIRMPVTKERFAKAFAAYYWREGKEFPENLSKKEGMKIVKDSLYMDGILGIYTEHWDAASDEFIGTFNRAYIAGLDWTEKNHPYLK